MNPDLPDPYHTMALVHEAKGEHKKAFDFSMLAAHLTPKVRTTRFHTIQWNVQPEYSIVYKNRQCQRITYYITRP